MRRDIHGFYRLIKLIDNFEDFDSMELLGLFAGDIIFLRNVIEAKYGKPFDYEDVLGWEISQMIGVTEKKKFYTTADLPLAVRDRIKLLDAVVNKIMRSDLNDIPASLRSRPVEFKYNDPYDFEGC